MRHIDIKEVRQNLRELIERVEHGERVVITRQGQAVAQLVPPLRQSKELPSLKKFRKGIARNGTPAAQLLRGERNARRPSGGRLFPLRGLDH